MVLNILTLITIAILNIALFNGLVYFTFLGYIHILKEIKGIKDYDFYKGNIFNLNKHIDVLDRKILAIEKYLCDNTLENTK